MQHRTIKNALRLQVLDPGPDPLGLCRECGRSERRTGASLPQRISAVPFPAVRKRRPGLLPGLRPLRLRQHGPAAHAGAGSRRQDPAASRLAGRLGCRLQVACRAANDDQRQGRRRQTGGLDDRTGSRARRMWSSTSRSRFPNARSCRTTIIRCAWEWISAGGSRFRGQIGRATMFRGALKPDMIRETGRGRSQRETDGRERRPLPARTESRRCSADEARRLRRSGLFRGMDSARKRRGRPHLRQAHRRTARRLPDRLLAEPEPARHRRPSPGRLPRRLAGRCLATHRRGHGQRTVGRVFEWKEAPETLAARSGRQEWQLLAHLAESYPQETLNYASPRQSVQKSEFSEYSSHRPFNETTRFSDGAGLSVGGPLLPRNTGQRREQPYPLATFILVPVVYVGRV